MRVIRAGPGPSMARLAASGLPVADSLGYSGGAMAVAVYLVEVEIVLRLLQLKFLAFLLTDTQQQIIKHMVVPVDDQQRESVPSQAHSRGKGTSKDWGGGGNMAPLVAKPEESSLITGTHLVQRGN